MDAKQWLARKQQYEECVTIQKCHIGLTIRRMEGKEQEIADYLEQQNALAAQRVLRHCRNAPHVSSLGINSENYSTTQQVHLRFFLLDVLQSLSPIQPTTFGVNELHGVIRLLGNITPQTETPAIDSDSITICCNVHGLKHHFYAIPEVCKPFRHRFMEYYTRHLESYLNDFVCRHFILEPEPVDALEFFRSPNNGTPVLINKPSVAVTLHPLGQLRRTIIQYDDDKLKGCAKDDEWPVFKITTALPIFIPYAAEGAQRHYIRMSGSNSFLNVYGTRIPFSTRFLLEKRISVNRWISLPAGSFYLREWKSKESVQMLEVDIHMNQAFQNDIVETAPEPMPPIRLLSFDFETLTRGKFAVGKCELIQAGIELRRYYNRESRVICKMIVVIGSCRPINDTIIINVPDRNPVSLVGATQQNPIPVHQESERDLLLWWGYILKVLDPEGMCGFNSKGFDFLHAYHRINFLSIFGLTPPPVSAWRMGKLVGGSFTVAPLRHDLEWKYRFHRQDIINVHVPGVFLPDLYQLYQRHEAIPPGQHYKLKHIAKRHLPRETFEDLNINQINTLHAGNSRDRRMIAVYCLSDTQLVSVLLLRKMPQSDQDVSMLDYYLDYAQETGISIRLLMDKSFQFIELWRKR